MLKIKFKKNSLLNNSRQNGYSLAEGFTLIEVSVVLFFAGLLLVVMFNLYDWHSKIYSYQQAYVRVSTGNRQVVSTMQDYITQSYKVLSSATINGVNYTTGSDVLVLQLPALDANNNVIFGLWDKVAFYKSGFNIFIQVEPDPGSSRLNLNKILNDSVQSFVLTYNNVNLSLVNKVTLSLTSAAQARSQTVSSGMTQDMFLLNY